MQQRCVDVAPGRSAIRSQMALGISLWVCKASEQPPQCDLFRPLTMPRVPKRVPNWFNQFTEYAREKEKSAAKRQAIHAFEDVVERRWEAFVAKSEKESPPKKRQPVDPVKSLENAMQKVAKQVDTLEGPEQIQEVRDRLLGAMPPQVQELLQRDAVAAAAPGAEVMEQISTLYAQTALCKTNLEQLATTVPAEQAEFKQSALQAVQDVCNGLENIRTALTSPKRKREEEDEEEDAEATEDEPEPEDEAEDAEEDGAVEP